MKTSEFRDYLLRAKEDGALVAVYSQPGNSDTFAAGWVEAVTGEHVLLRHVTPSGLYDGFVLRMMENVFRIERDGANEDRLVRLYQAREQHHPADFVGPLEDGANLLIETFLAAQRHDLAVGVGFEDDDVYGWVKTVGSETLVMERINDLGHLDGESFLSYDEIEIVNVDDELLQNFKLLDPRHHDRPPDWLGL